MDRLVSLPRDSYTLRVVRTNEHPAVAQCHARWGSHHFAQEPL
jgi:hypothetical protein